MNSGTSAEQTYTPQPLGTADISPISGINKYVLDFLDDV
jgi:hypothetical protein